MPWRPFVAVLLALTILTTACSGSSESERLAEISVYDFNRQPQLVVHEGRPLVINFFAESCAPCVAEMPAFESVFQTVSDRVDFIGVSEDATADAGSRIVRATGITYRSFWDGDGTAFAQFEAFGMPTTVFVTGDGTVAEVHTGALSADALTAKISELLGV